MGFMVDKAAPAQVFSDYFFSPVTHSNDCSTPITTHHHPSSGAGTINQTMADVPTGLSHPTARN
jgi:hypothetical protein